MTPSDLDVQLAALLGHWRDYRAGGRFEQFVELTLALNSLAERLARLRLPGLVRQCEGLENAALALFGDETTHPVGEQDMAALERQVETLAASIGTLRQPAPIEERRGDEGDEGSVDGAPVGAPARVVWLIAPPTNAWARGLAEQLAFYGLRVHSSTWEHMTPPDDPPFAVLFVPAAGAAHGLDPAVVDLIGRMRQRCASAQMFYLGVPPQLDAMVTLMRAGIDIPIRQEEQVAALLSRILDLIQAPEQERYRVLVVEDSKVAVAQIRRALDQHGIDSTAIADPSHLFESLDHYRPDLVLMDMYMPSCTGVEATRALRQLPAYQATPVVYLSGETDVALQVEALRLGGDQFLTKPFNPVLLAATVRTTIERHRAMRRASRHDGLTGLLNHTAAKAELDARVAALPPGASFSVAMVDIDHFKSINDTYGHPVGDQVIRSLAWLLKGRLRSADLIGRYGGEEFLIAMPDTALDDAVAVLDRLRLSFNKLAHAHAGGAFNSSFSSGVAAFPYHATAGELIEAADEALLEAKRKGRNRVVPARLGSAAAAPRAGEAKPAAPN